MQPVFRRILVFLSLIHLTGGCGQAVSIESEKAKLQGTWEVVEAERRGINDSGYIGLHYEFEGDRFRVASEVKKGEWAQYILDVAAFPQRIESPHPHVSSKKSVIARTHGFIYRVENAKLQVCWAMDGKEYPKAFSSKPDNVLLTFRRIPFSSPDEERARTDAAAERAQHAAWQRLEPWASGKSQQGKYDVDFHGWLETSWHSIWKTHPLKFPSKITERQWQALLTLRDIRLLGLRGCDVGDEQMQYIGKLVSLEALDLHSTDVSDKGLRQLTKLGNLEQLDLSFTAITDTGLVTLRTMASLKKVILQGTSVTKKGLEELGAVRKDLQIDWPRSYTESQQKAACALSQLGLEIDDKVDQNTKATTCEIAIPCSIAIREHAVAAKPGEQPGLPRTGVTMLNAAVVAGYFEKLPAPTSVDTRNTNMNDSIIESLQGIQGLTRLNLRKSGITDAGVGQLERHEDLRVLDLSYCKSVTGKGVAHVASLTHLERLGLSGIKLTPADLAPLLDLGHLKALAIDRNTLNRDLSRRFRQKGVELRFYGF